MPPARRREARTRSRASRRLGESFETWMRDTGEAVRVALRHLERCPGAGGSWLSAQLRRLLRVALLRHGRDMPDTGPAMTRRFRAWLRETWNGALRIAWKDPGAL